MSSAPWSEALSTCALYVFQGDLFLPFESGTAWAGSRCQSLASKPPRAAGNERPRQPQAFLEETSPTGLQEAPFMEDSPLRLGSSPGHQRSDKIGPWLRGTCSSEAWQERGRSCWP